MGHELMGIIVLVNNFIRQNKVQFYIELDDT